ncbi:MAG: response regulator [Bacteroidota bacterium]
MKRILYLEDDAINAYVIQKQVGNMADVTLFTDPHEALRMLRAPHISFDMFLVDVHLGEGVMDGITFCRKAREIPAYKDALYVAVTAFAMPGDMERLLKEGFDAYVSKPIVRSSFLNVLSKIVQVN